jgi:hypothetical protein
VAIVAFFLTYNPWGYVGAAGTPMGYGIVRGIDPTFNDEPEPTEGLGVGPYPSDHVVMPLEFINNTGNEVLIKNPRLVFIALGDSGELTGEGVRFLMIGELRELSNQELAGIQSQSDAYSSSNSIPIESHSAAKSVPLFRVEKWWEEYACFRFIPGQAYQVVLEFERVPEPPLWHKSIQRQLLVERLTIQPTADFLNVYGPEQEGESIGWDFHSLLPGSRSLQADTLPRADPESRYKEEPPCQ